MKSILGDIIIACLNGLTEHTRDRAEDDSTSRTCAVRNRRMPHAGDETPERKAVPLAEPAMLLTTTYKSLARTNRRWVA
jgi:hypothetical protein